MFKYLRMDAYRLIKTKTLYVALGIILAAVAFSVYMMSTAAMPDLSATGGEGPSSMAIQNGKELGSFTQTQSGLWIWTTVLLVSVVVAQFFALDFSSGFVKSLPLSRRDRLDYYGGKIVFVVMLSTAFSVSLCSKSFSRRQGSRTPMRIRSRKSPSGTGCCCLSFGRMECWPRRQPG